MVKEVHEFSVIKKLKIWNAYYIFWQFSFHVLTKWLIVERGGRSVYFSLGCDQVTRFLYQKLLSTLQWVHVRTLDILGKHDNVRPLIYCRKYSITVRHWRSYLLRYYLNDLPVARHQENFRIFLVIFIRWKMVVKKCYNTFATYVYVTTTDIANTIFNALYVKPIIFFIANIFPFDEMKYTFPGKLRVCETNR